MAVKRQVPQDVKAEAAAKLRVFIMPRFEGPDTGEGGIRRVVEAQRRWLPTHGVEVVDRIEDADVVHAHAVLDVKTNKPVVVTCHGLYWAEYEWPNWCHNANRAVIEALHRADAVTAVSAWVGAAIERNTWVKPDVVYHGIELDDWKPVDSAVKGEYVLWNKTRIDPICDPSPMQELARMAPSVQFVSTFGEATKNVKITGKLPFSEGQEYVRGAAVYLCTARETFGIGTLEAMAAGVPILGWAWGGQREIVSHGVDGWLASPGDFAGLAEGLQWCLDHRVEAGIAARNKVAELYQACDVVAGYVPIYERVLREHEERQATRVSVVVTCYNLGQYVGDAVKSAVQAGANEVVVVDDASTDGSADVCDVVASDYPGVVRVVHNERNLYLAGALNTGIAASKGRYVVPLDADNLLTPDSLGVLADALDAGAVDIAYGAMGVIEEGGKHYTSTWPASFDFAQQITHHNQIPSTSMYRRSVWQRVGGYRRRCRTAEDADFWCRATSFGARAEKVTDMVTFVYRDRHDSMSHTNADWPWNQWYPWWRDPKTAPPISPMKGPVWSYEPIKVSVVITVGPGHDKLVLDALDSLVAQTFRWWEAIVVNDSGVALAWVHPFARVLNTSGGVGPAVGRNLGANLARGRVIVPLDGDDYLQPNALEVLWETWQAYGPQAYVYSDWIVQETGEIKEAEEYNCETVLQKLPHAVTAAYPREAFREVGGFDEKLDAWEDWDFVIALNAAGYCGVRAPYPLLQYRMRTGFVREAMYARKDALVANIRAKWARFYNGEEKLMACGGCGGKSSPATQARSQVEAQRMQQQQQAMVVKGELVLLEYVGKIGGPTMYRGAVSGQHYRFGLDPHHKIKYVHRDDAMALLTRGDFVAGKPSAELLQAAGV